MNKIIMHKDYITIIPTDNTKWKDGDVIQIVYEDGNIIEKILLR